MVSREISFFSSFPIHSMEPQLPSKVVELKKQEVLDHF